MNPSTKLTIADLILWGMIVGGIGLYVYSMKAK
jgi:hypothetical protein